MSDMPAVIQASVPRMATKTYVVSDYRVLADGWLHEDRERLVNVDLTLRPNSTRSETDILRDALVQHYLTLVARKLTVRLNRHITVTIGTFRPPSYDEFLTGYEGRVTDDLGKLYAECRGLTCSILWMLHKDFKESFRDD